MQKGVVGGVILEESVVFDKGDEPIGDALRALGRMRHWNVKLGMACHSHRHSLASVQSTAAFYSCDSFLVGSDNPSIVWVDFDSSRAIVYVSSKATYRRLPSFLPRSCAHYTILLDEDSGAFDACNPESNTFSISKLDYLPYAICRINAQAIGNNAIIVGYAMKPSREEDFAKRGAFPVSPGLDGLMFFPLSLQLPLAPQLQQVDVILHKATDEIVSVELGDSVTVTYTEAMQELHRYLERNFDCLVIDPLQNICPVLDRLKTQHVLHCLDNLNSVSGERSTIRGPYFSKVDNFDQNDLVQLMSQSNLSFPCIVKPQVACGVAEAHSMAIVFGAEDFKDLTVPLPGIIQEYVDHSSTLFKIYCLGSRVFYAVKKSIPNADGLLKFSEERGSGPLLFDSLKSLPTIIAQTNGDNACESLFHRFDLELVTDAAHWLAKELGLTIFGFDVVIHEASGDHVIVDVNFLPSFKEVRDEIALPAFWAAIKHKFESKKAKLRLERIPYAVV